MRHPLRLHLAAIVLLAVGVCLGVASRGGRPTGADVKRRAAGSASCSVATPGSGWASAGRSAVAAALDALPDGATFRPADAAGVPTVGPGVWVLLTGPPDAFLVVGEAGVWVQGREWRKTNRADAAEWLRADLRPDDAARVRTGLLAAASETPAATARAPEPASRPRA